MKRLLAIIGCIGMVSCASVAKADLLTNGSFELGQAINPTQGYETINGFNNTSITGWVVAGSVDYIGGYWKASDGGRSIDLSGGGNGSVSQQIATTAGQQYLVSFDIAGNPDGPIATKTGSIDVMFAGQMLSFTNTSATTKQSMGWETETFLFTANSSSTDLRFASNTNTAYGLALDHVAVSAVPLPASFPLFAGALVALGGIAFVSKRKSLGSFGTA